MIVERNTKIVNNLILISVFSLAFFVRFYNLSLFPLNHDEVTWTLRSIENFDRFFGVPVACFKGYIQSFFSYLVFFTEKIFNDPLYVIRLPSVIIGSATVMLLYMLAKEMYGRTAGFISSALLCLLPWHVIQSRIGVSLILTPFFGCLIFLAFVRSLNKKSNLWFFLSLVFLGIGSFYTYQGSLLFIPIFFIALVFTRRELKWLRLRIIVTSVLVFLIILLPIICLYSAGELSQYFGKIYRMYYHDVPFQDSAGQFLVKSYLNFRKNVFNSFRGLFFARGNILYGRALRAPLLINYAAFFAIVFFIFIALSRRNSADKIILAWLIFGYLGAVSGVRLHDARYSIAVLPSLLISVAGFTTFILSKWMSERNSFKKRLYFFLGAGLCLGLVSAEACQLVDYYYRAPFDLDECRNNSYGCKESARYLSQIPDIEDYQIIVDSSMEALDTYLDYYLSSTITADNFYEMPKRKSGQEQKGTYYVLWAPERHPEDFKGGQFSWMWKRFRAQEDHLAPAKTIYYPNGLAAINIFKTKRGNKSD